MFDSDKAVIDLDKYVELLKRKEIDEQNISLIRQSFETCIVLFANIKKDNPNLSLKKALEELGINLEVKFRGDKKEDIRIEDIDYSLNFK